jgi:hypothetical protein
MTTKNKSFLVIITLATIFLIGCAPKDVKQTTDNISLAEIKGVSQNTNIDLDYLPTEIALNSENENITRKIVITERDKCSEQHPFGFETYLGEFTTINNEQLKRLSYPEIGDDLLFIVDEYGYLLDNGKCLTFSYNATVSEAIINGEYNKNIYFKELDIAAQIMSTLTLPKN